MSRLYSKKASWLDFLMPKLEEEHPETVRQVDYQMLDCPGALDSFQGKNPSRALYQSVSRLMVTARLEGIVPWDWIVDETRGVEEVYSYEDLGEYLAAVKDSFHLDVWKDQARRVIVWLEKDALARIFWDVLRPYRVNLHVGRGYDGWTSIREAAERYKGQNVSLLYFGDHDATGLHISESLEGRFARLDFFPKITVCALTHTQAKRLPTNPIPPKVGDTRAKAYIEKYGHDCWELDAMPPKQLRALIKREVVKRMDMEAFEASLQHEAKEKRRLVELLEVRP